MMKFCDAMWLAQICLLLLQMNGKADGHELDGQNDEDNISRHHHHQYRHQQQQPADSAINRQQWMNRERLEYTKFSGFCPCLCASVRSEQKLKTTAGQKLM